MAYIYQLRGTNGSGKSTIIRRFLPPNDETIQLSAYDAPTKLKPDRVKRVEGYFNPEWSAMVIGPYHTACGGMDALPGFAVCQNAIDYVVSKPNFQLDNVLCEGVLASTVYGSWGAFAEGMKVKGHKFVPVYLQTPIEVCLSRIQQRQLKATGSLRDIKTDQVIAKVKAIEATRKRFQEAGFGVIDLPYGFETEAMEAVLKRDK